MYAKYAVLALVLIAAAAVATSYGGEARASEDMTSVDSPYIPNDVENLVKPSATLEVYLLDRNGRPVTMWRAPIGSVIMMFSKSEVDRVVALIRLNRVPDVSVVNAWGFRATININATIFTVGREVRLPFSVTELISRDEAVVNATAAYLSIDVDTLAKYVPEEVNEAVVRFEVYGYLCAVSGDRDVVCSYTERPIVFTAKLVRGAVVDPKPGESSETVAPPSTEPPTEEPVEPDVESWKLSAFIDLDVWTPRCQYVAYSAVVKVVRSDGVQIRSFETRLDEPKKTIYCYILESGVTRKRISVHCYDYRRSSEELLDQEPYPSWLYEFSFTIDLDSMKKKLGIDESEHIAYCRFVSYMCGNTVTLQPDPACPSGTRAVCSAGSMCVPKQRFENIEIANNLQPVLIDAKGG